MKCVDRETGEEIYHNTTLPKAVGSWASEDEALKAIGAKVADEFSRDFFLQHFALTGRKVTLTIDGMPPPAPDDALERELLGLPAVLTAAARVPANPRRVRHASSRGPARSPISSRPACSNRSTPSSGRACFSLGRVAGDEVDVAFDKACADAAVMARLETNPPAGLYGAPPGRQRDVVRDAETLRKLAI